MAIGANDIWNIVVFQFGKKQRLLFIDRYGKCLNNYPVKLVDRTYNGVALPSDDYWFKLSFLDHNGNVQPQSKLIIILFKRIMGQNSPITVPLVFC